MEKNRLGNRSGKKIDTQDEKKNPCFFAWCELLHRDPLFRFKSVIATNFHIQCEKPITAVTETWKIFMPESMRMWQWWNLFLTESKSNPRSELKPKSHSQTKSRTADGEWTICLSIYLSRQIVWWTILGIWIYPSKVHTHSSEHTHTHREHTPGAVGSHLCTRGAVGGSVSCSRAPQSWYWRRRERWTFTPSTYNSCWPETGTHNFWIMSPIYLSIYHIFV